MYPVNLFNEEGKNKCRFSPKRYKDIYKHDSPSENRRKAMCNTTKRN